MNLQQVALHETDLQQVAIREINGTKTTTGKGTKVEIEVEKWRKIVAPEYKKIRKKIRKGEKKKERFENVRR